MPDERTSLPLALWPAADRDHWQRALRADDLFGPSSIAANWRPATVAWVEDGYGRALYWLSHNDLLDPDQPAGERWTANRLRSYLASLRARNLSPVTVRGRFTALERALAVIAPRSDRGPLQSAIAKLCVTPDQHHKRLRLQDPAQLVELGHKLMAEAETGLRPHPRMDAAVFRDGLQIALLALRPLRKRNFTALQIGQHVVQADGRWWLLVDRDETKTGQPIDVPFPDALVPALHRYIEYYRARLAGDRYAGDRLWVSYRFGAQSAHSIQLQITDHTERVFGRSVCPHLFRDCAATSIAINDPENVRMATTILGHRTLATTEKHYNLAQSVQAGDAYNNYLADRRRGIRQR